MPRTPLSREVSLRWANLAARAPSSHNTQPWRFALHEGRLRLIGDPSRRLPVNDPDDREWWISLGCAALGLRVAAAADGVALRCASIDPVGSITFDVDEGPADPALAALAPALSRRHTARGTLLPEAPPADLLGRLREAAESEGALLQYVPHGPDRRVLASLVAEGDAQQWSEPRWRAELAGWMRPPGSGDGLSLPRWQLPLAHWTVRRFNLGARIGRDHARALEAAPAVLLLQTAEDDAASRLAAGCAIHRLLLEAAAQGFQATWFNQPNQCAALRLRLRRAIPGGWPQLLLTLARPRGAAPAPTPRRPAALLDA